MAATMKQLFGHHHKLSDTERLTLWNQATFVVDANALLNIYRYADSTRADLFRVLEAVKTRIWVPYQAAKEFYENRIDVIRDQKKKYDDLENGLQKAIGILRGGDFAKSAFLNIEEIEGMIKPSIEKAREKIAARRADHPNLLHDDPYLERLVDIVGDSIGKEQGNEDFQTACNRAQDRLDRKQPPGYLDADKPIPQRYGDVLIWFEMLDHARSTKKPLIFVTDDEKDDWWLKVGGERLAARPELREEMQKVAGVQFHLANPAHFLQSASDQLRVEVAESSVQNAADVAEEIRGIQRRTILDLAAIRRTLVGELESDLANRLIERELQDSDLANRLIQRELQDSDLANAIRDTARGKWYSEIANRRLAADYELMLGSRSQRTSAKEGVKRWLESHLPDCSISETSIPPFDFVVKTPDLRARLAVEVFRIPALVKKGLASLIDNAFSGARDAIQKRKFLDYCLFLVATNAHFAEEVLNFVKLTEFAETFKLSIGYLHSSGSYEEIGAVNGSIDQP